jgi:hypothetical protein
MVIDETRVREILEEEFERLLNEKISGRDPSIMDRIQALEDKIETIESHLGL